MLECFYLNLDFIVQFFEVTLEGHLLLFEVFYECGFFDLGLLFIFVWIPFHVFDNCLCVLLVLIKFELRHCISMKRWQNISSWIFALGLLLLFVFFLFGFNFLFDLIIQIILRQLFVRVGQIDEHLIKLLIEI